ncbi:MAG: YggT family protein [Thermoleophilia bacterium]
MDQVETYVSALFTVFILCIFVRILLSFVPNPPVSGAPRAIWNFFHQSTDWFLNIFRRIIPPLGMFDLSPIVAILVLYIVRSLVLNLL